MATAGSVDEDVAEGEGQQQRQRLLMGRCAFAHSFGYGPSRWVFVFQLSLAQLFYQCAENQAVES